MEWKANWILLRVCSYSYHKKTEVWLSCLGISICKWDVNGATQTDFT